MMRLYNWIVCTLFKICVLEIKAKPKTSFERYCEENPWAEECRIYEV
jgi:hypothetical protein